MNLQLKPLPPTANLFVDFCDHLFFMGKRANPYHDKKIMLDLCTMRIKIVCLYSCNSLDFLENMLVVLDERIIYVIDVDRTIIHQ